MGWFTAIGQAAGSAAATGGIGMGFQRLGSRYDRRMAEKLQRQQMGIQMEGEKHMSNFQKQQEFEMWQKTGPQGMKKELKAAGLNPALMYGMGGSAGQTVGGGVPAVQGGSGTYIDTAGAAAGMGIQGIRTMAELQILKAQKENIEADTKNKLAGNPNIGLEGENIQARTAGQKLANDIAELDKKLKSRTLDWNVERAFEEWTKIAEERNILTNKRIAQGEDGKNEVKKMEAEITLLGVQAALVEANKDKAVKEKENIESQIAARVTELAMAQNRIDIEQQLADWETSYGKQVAGLLGNVINLIPGLTKAPPKAAKGGKK